MITSLGAGKTTASQSVVQLPAGGLSRCHTGRFINVTSMWPLWGTLPVSFSGCRCALVIPKNVLLCKAAASGKGDLLLIELNGTADPLALLETFTLLEKRLPLFPRWQVCVIDARRWEEEDALTLLKRRQLETSGFWYLSHGDQLQPEALERIRGSISSFSEHAVASSVDELIGLLQHEINGRQDPSWTPKPIQSTSSSKTAKSLQTGILLPLLPVYGSVCCRIGGPATMKALVKCYSWVSRQGLNAFMTSLVVGGFESRQGVAYRPIRGKSFENASLLCTSVIES